MFIKNINKIIKKFIKSNKKNLDTMKIYTVKTKNEVRAFYSLTEAKAFMKTNPGSTGTITKCYANGDWEPCGEIVLNGRNSVQMCNQTTATY